LDVQAERIAAYCTAQGLELVALVREEGVSGGIPLADRRGGADLLRLVAEHGARHIVAFKLDRLFRDAMDALGQTREWDQAGIALHVIDMGGQTINTANAVGRMFLTMTAAFAELERNLISERTSSALRHKASKGEAVSRAPRGLRIVGGRFEVDPQSDGLAIYARACALRRGGFTYRAIADRLNEEGYSAERGARIHATVVRRWINNPSLARAAGAE
jgi:DNA invertase Pin-like site-specific DNA recombinase